VLPLIQGLPTRNSTEGITEWSDMNFNYWDLGQQPGGAIVQVNLERPHG
jgi:hypothetical protein